MKLNGGWNGRTDKASRAFGASRPGTAAWRAAGASSQHGAPRSWPSMGHDAPQQDFFSAAEARGTPAPTRIANAKTAANEDLSLFTV